ncbi:MAG: DUF4278 domain-containing protein [Pleurocapsa sp.]
MHLLFLIPLVTGITASYINKYSSDEIGYLMRTLAFFCFVLSLILAPWQVKLIILTVVLGSVYQIWLYRSEPELETEGQELSKSELKEVESKYRGVSYQANHSNLELPPKELIAVKYRGKLGNIVHSHAQSPPQSQFELKYRGVSIDHQDKPSQNTDRSRGERRATPVQKSKFNN